MRHVTRSLRTSMTLLLACAGSCIAPVGCGSDSSQTSASNEPTEAGMEASTSDSATTDGALNHADGHADGKIDGPAPDAAPGDGPAADSALEDSHAPDGAEESAATDAPHEAAPDAPPAPGCTLDPVAGSDNQVPINSALQKCKLVHLNAGTYVISDTILMKTGNTLEGETGTVIKLVGNAGWAKYKAIIEGHSISNVHLTRIEVDGNGPNNTTSNGASTVCGKYYYTMVYFTDSTTVELDHLYLHDNWNDIFKFSQSSDIKFHDNTVRREGHDVVYAIHSHDVQVYNNSIKIACNSGVRPDSTTDIYIYKNDITRDGGGYAGVEIQGTSEVWICDNNIYGLKGPDVANLSGSPVHTSGCPTAGPPDFPQVP